MILKSKTRDVKSQIGLQNLKQGKILNHIIYNVLVAISLSCMCLHKQNEDINVTHIW